MRSDGPFKPLTVGIDTTIYPGFDGGAEWGGPAYDPDTGLLYVNANEMAWLGSLAPNDTGRSTGKSIYLRDCAACHGDNLQGSPPQFPVADRTRQPHDAGRFHRAGSQGRRPHAGVPGPAGRGAARRGALRVRGRGHPGRRARPVAHQPGVPFHRLSPLARSGRLSRHRHALGHAERHRSRHRQIRLAHSLRRISRARRARRQGHRQ